MTTNVNTYCASTTANVNCGGTKNQSNASTFTIAASTAGPRPNSSAIPTTASRNSITMFDSSNRCCKGNATSVVVADRTSEQPYRRHCDNHCKCRFAACLRSIIATV